MMSPGTCADPLDAEADDGRSSRRLRGKVGVILVPLLLAVGATVLAGGPAQAEPSDTMLAQVELAQVELAQVDLALGAQVYADNCSRCHEPDGSGLPGEVPPLLNNPNAADTDYVETVVRDGLEGPIEVLGIAYDDAMRALGDKLSDEEITAVVAYVATLATRGETDTGAGVVEIEPGDVDEGHALFVGSNRFANDGAACAACHTAGKVGNLGGWSLGPDLTGTVESFGSEAALVSWLGDPKSNTMAPLFEEHQLTDNEIADLVVFLVDAPLQAKPSDPGDGLVLAGAVGFLILIGGMAVAWRGMRQTYAQRLRSRR